MRNRILFLQRLVFAAVILLMPVAIAIQVSVWNECRASGHSFFYCMALVSHR